MNNNKHLPDIRIANGFEDALTQIAMTAKDLFEEHPAASKILNYDTMPTTEAAYIFGVCNAATQLAVALMRANNRKGNVHPLPFKIDFDDAKVKYKEAFAEKEDNEEEQYHQITIDELLEFIKTKRTKPNNKQKPKKGE